MGEKFLRKYMEASVKTDSNLPGRREGWIARFESRISTVTA
jgi:hypothetical protein